MRRTDSTLVFFIFFFWFFLIYLLWKRSMVWHRWQWRQRCVPWHQSKLWKMLSAVPKIKKFMSYSNFRFLMYIKCTGRRSKQAAHSLNTKYEHSERGDKVDGSTGRERETSKRNQVQTTTSARAIIHSYKPFECETMPRTQYQWKLIKFCSEAIARGCVLSFFIFSSAFFPFNFWFSVFLLLVAQTTQSMAFIPRQNGMFFPHFVCHGKVLFAQIFTYTLT